MSRNEQRLRQRSNLSVCRACFGYADEHDQHVMTMNAPTVEVTSAFDAFKSYQPLEPTDVVVRWESNHCSGFINDNGDTDPRMFYSWKAPTDIDSSPMIPDREQIGFFDD